MSPEEIEAWKNHISTSAERAKEVIAFWLSVSRYKVEIDVIVDARVKAEIKWKKDTKRKEKEEQ